MSRRGDRYNRSVPNTVCDPFFMTFADLGLSESLLKAVRGAGYAEPTPIQAQAIPVILAGRDVLGCAQTGTGKTAAFALPILQYITQSGRQPRGQRRKVRVLVLAPTRELAQQIADSFRTYGRHSSISVVEVYGGVDPRGQIQLLKEGAEVVVATPGRLIDLMGQGLVELKWVDFLILDEADRMLDMGFIPDVRQIVAELPTRRQTLFFSATLPRAVIELASDLLSDPVEVEVAPEKVTADQIDQSVYLVAKRNKPILLAHLLKTRPMSKVLVFCATKHGTDMCVRSLHRAGVKAEALHGDKSQGMREKALQHFAAGKTPVLAATDVAARGIDYAGITHVINYDLPFDAETYVHRIGRTARAGAAGVAITLCDDRERGMLATIQRLIRQELLVNTDHPEYPPAPEKPEAEEDERATQESPTRPPQSQGRGQTRHRRQRRGRR